MSVKRRIEIKALDRGYTVEVESYGSVYSGDGPTHYACETLEEMLCQVIRLTAQSTQWSIYQDKIQEGREEVLKRIEEMNKDES